MKKSPKRAKSFTLIEVLLAASIFAMLIIFGISAFSTIVSWKKKTGSENSLQAAGRHALEVMTNEIEKANLNFTPNTAGQSPQRFGFYMNNPSLTFYDGPVTGAVQIWVYSPSDTTTFWSFNNRLYKNVNGVDSNLIPSNVSVASLTFDGYQKTSTSYSSSSYQQPYVTIKLTLSAQVINPQTNQPETKTADFRTTVRPQGFDNLGYAEVASGADNTPSEAIFGVTFSKKPVVVIARKSHNEDDQDSYIRDTFLDRFTYASSIGDQSLANRYYYWLAVNGNYPHLIKAGQVTGNTIPCGTPASSACINYYLPFASGGPVSFLTRENSQNDAPLFWVRENTNQRLVVSGPGWDRLFNWISINQSMNNLQLGSSGVPTLKVGNSPTTVYPANPNGNLSCKRCQCTTGSPPQTVDTNPAYYSCAFYYRPTNYFPNPNLFTVPFDTTFSSMPDVLVTAKNINGNVNPYAKASLSQLNTPGVRTIMQNYFNYTNLGNSGDIGETSEHPCPSQSCNQYNNGWNTDNLFTAAGLTALQNGYSVNWIAMSDNFKLTWEYK